MPSLTRRQTMRGIAGALTAMALPLPAWVAAQPGPESVAAVRFAWWSDVGTPTPFQVSTVGPGGAVLLSLLYDTLTWKDATGIIPWLASAWEPSPDGRGYIFHLVDGATWHDGRPVTAEDVAFSFDYYAQHPFRWMTTEVVEAATVVGDGAVRIALKRPSAAFLEDIAGVVPIIPRHIWESVADPVAYTGPDRTVGSGPFTLAAYDRTQGAYRLLAQENYWRGRPLVQEWQQITVPAEARVQVVQRSDADVSLSTDASVRDLLADDPRLRVFETAPLSIVRLVINTERPPFDRKEVRQAIAYALDRRLIAETITRGPAIVGSAGVVPPETPWHNPSLKRYDHDAQRARELLGGQRYTVDLIADANAREPDLMQPMLEAVGITLNIERVDAPTRAQLLGEGTFQLALTSHIGVGGDPDYLRRWYAGEEANAFAQGSIFRNAEYARLGEEQAATLEPEKRREVVFRMQEILAEELPTVVLYHRRFYWVYDPVVFTPMETWGGLMNGVPFPNNKLALIAT
ncbi:MAG: ABC transporter substrate-binding protein [Chloroflexota bacterium]|nr:ABC transporter substrate-binding protein [Chloroflexota bacterium]